MCGALWAKGLAGFDRVTVIAALQRHIKGGDEWPPTLPGLRSLCFNIPTFATVRSELIGAKHGPFARLVWSYIDAHRFRTADTVTSERILREAYDAAREHVMRGGELPTESPALPSPAPMPTEFEYRPGAGTPSMDAIAEILGRPDPEPPARAPDPDLAAAERELRQHYGTVRELIDEVSQ